MNKHIVYVNNIGKVENIINFTGLEDLYAAYKLLSTPENKYSDIFKPLDEFLCVINAMKLRQRYNSHRDIKAYIWVTDLKYGALWDRLEEDKDYFHHFKKLAKPFNY